MANRQAAGSGEIPEQGTPLHLPISFRAASIQPDSINEESRSVEVIFSTGAPWPRFDRALGAYMETLSLNPKHIRTDRLNNGAPLMNSHAGGAALPKLSDQIGVVEPGSVRIANGQARARVRFSRRADVEPIWQDVRDGIVRNVSAGYRVHKYEQRGDTDPPNLHAIDWEPFEVSAVAMGADNDAKFRDDQKTQTNPCVIVTRAAEEITPMDPTTQQATELEPHDLLAPGAPLPLPTPATRTAVVPNEADAAADAERERIQGILRGCTAARLPMSTAEKLIADKTPLVKAQGIILDSMRVTGVDEQGPRPGPSGVQVTGADHLENVWRGIENAILHKIDPAHFKLEDIGRPYRTRALLTSAEMCLQYRGIRTTDMPRTQIAGLALGLSTRAGLHTTSDFAGIFENVARKMLRTSYDEAAQTFGPITRRIPLTDFKPLAMNQIGEFPAFLKVLEHGEFTRGTITAGKETMTLTTWGRVFGITRQALINDDLDAFSQLALKAGRSARNMESDLVWAEITNNAAMGDGVALFHATHRNLSGTNDVISITSLGRARAAMRNQLGLDGVTRVNVTPRYLIVPPALETVAQQFVATNTVAAQASNNNPFAGTLQVIAEPRLEVNSATAWYVAGDPAQIDMILTGFLDGEEGPMVESRVGFDVDALEIKGREDYAAKVTEFRGLYKNIGA